LAGQFTIYRDNAALQANLQQATWEEPDNLKNWNINKGAIWVEVANGTGEDKSWDWQNKIIWKMGPVDIETILAGWQIKDGKQCIPLFHKDQNEVNNTLTIRPGEDTLTFRKDGTSVSVFATRGQWIIFNKLMSDSYADIIGWRLQRERSTGS